VEELKKKVPTNNKNKIYENENENKIVLIQNFIRRRKQTSNFVHLGKFNFFINTQWQRNSEKEINYS
jgi:hypothetical protein